MWATSAIDLMEGVMLELDVYNPKIHYGIITAGIAKFKGGTIVVDTDKVSDCPINLGELTFPKYKSGYSAEDQNGMQHAKYMDFEKVCGGIHPLTFLYHDDKFRKPEYPYLREIKKCNLTIINENFFQASSQL